jgi:hypothetical protein
LKWMEINGVFQGKNHWIIERRFAFVHVIAELNERLVVDCP